MITQQSPIANCVKNLNQRVGVTAERDLELLREILERTLKAVALPHNMRSTQHGDLAHNRNCRRFFPMKRSAASCGHAFFDQIAFNLPEPQR
jgi:hypothetical protein